MSYEHGVKERKKTIMELAQYIDSKVVYFDKLPHGNNQMNKDKLGKAISDLNYIPHLDWLIDMIQRDIDRQRNKKDASK